MQTSIETPCDVGRTSSNVFDSSEASAEFPGSLERCTAVNHHGHPFSPNRVYSVEVLTILVTTRPVILPRIWKRYRLATFAVIYNGFALGICGNDRIHNYLQRFCLGNLWK